MYLGKQLVPTVAFAICATFILFYVDNRSNIPTYIAIPVLVALLTKYVVGDWDSGFRWTILDIPYWISVVGISYGTLLFLTQGHFLVYSTA